MSGFITIERDIWDHPLFKPEPMTEREAWMWMIAQAAWSGTSHRVGSQMVDVPRGAFMATLRDMQSAFMWQSDKRVRTFLEKLQRHEMIKKVSFGAKNARKTHVTICEYEEYQSRGRTESENETPRTTSSQPRTTGRMESVDNVAENKRTDAPRTHGGRTGDAVKKQGNKETKKEDTNVSLSVPDAIPANDLSLAVARYNDAANHEGWSKVQKLTPPRSKQLRARLKECGGLDGWDVAIEKARSSDFICGRAAKAWDGFGFDSMINAEKFTRLMEGKYDNRASNGLNGDNRTYAGADRPGAGTTAAFAAVAERESRGAAGG